jgi:hypothetical protein
MPTPTDRVYVAVRLLSKTTGKVTFVQLLGKPAYEQVGGENGSISYKLVSKNIEHAKWRKYAMRVHGDDLFPIQDARVQYVICVRFCEVAKFFFTTTERKYGAMLDDTNIPDVMQPQLVDLGINYAVGVQGDHSLDFYAHHDALRDFLLGEFRDVPLNAAVDCLADADACNVNLRTIGARHILNSAWSQRYAPLSAHARLAILIKENKVTTTKLVAESTERSNEPIRRILTNTLKRCPLTFDPDTSSLEGWLRKATAYIYGGSTTFSLGRVTMCSLMADPLHTIDLGDQMHAPYARTYGPAWCGLLKDAARSFLQSGVGDFGLADGRSCVFVAPRGEHAPPEYKADVRGTEALSYHKEGETTCWRHPMLFDTKTVDVSSDSRDVHALRGGAGLAVKATIMADGEWMLMRSSQYPDNVNLHKPYVMVKETASSGVKTRVRYLDGKNADPQSVCIATITGNNIGRPGTDNGKLDGGASVDSYTHALILNVRNGVYVGLPIAAAMILSRSCANKPKEALDAAYVRADGADFGETDARAAAVLAAFFKRIGVMVPQVNDEDDSDQVRGLRPWGAAPPTPPPAVVCTTLRSKVD